MPALDVADVIFHETVQIFDRIGRLQAPPDLLENLKPMERERLFEAFLKGPGRRSVHLLKLGVELFEG